MRGLVPEFDGDGSVLLVNSDLTARSPLIGRDFASSMTTSRRQDLVDTAMQLFYRNGFHAVGLDRILADTGVTKTTFYNHFESKDDLVVAVIQQRDRWWRDTFWRATSE
jgi:AcrR family transcriptional regulator